MQTTLLTDRCWWMGACPSMLLCVLQTLGVTAPLARMAPRAVAAPLGVSVLQSWAAVRAVGSAASTSTSAAPAPPPLPTNVKLVNVQPAVNFYKPVVTLGACRHAVGEFVSCARFFFGCCCRTVAVLCLVAALSPGQRHRCGAPRVTYADYAEEVEKVVPVTSFGTAEVVDTVTLDNR